MNGQIRIELRRAARAAAHALRVVRDRGAHGVMVDAEGRGDGADLPVLAVIEAANLGVLLGRDHGASPGTRDGSARAVEGARRFPGRRPCIATRPPGARSAPDPSSCPPAVWRAAPARLGSLIPHAGAIRALVIAMIEAAFGAAPMALARGADRRAARRRATRRRAIRVAAITRRADREEAIAAATDFLAKRRVHDVGAAARFDWTRRANRGTRETTGSVRRSIEAVTEGLEGSAPGPHLIRRSAQLTRRRSARPTSQEAVDADAAVDAQNAPTAAWKSR